MEPRGSEHDVQYRCPATEDREVGTVLWHRDAVSVASLLLEVKKTCGVLRGTGT